MLSKAAVEDAIRRTKSYRQAARYLGVSWSTFRHNLERLQIRGEMPAHSPPNIERDESDNQCVLTLRSTTIRTLEAALAEGHVDLQLWEVERWVLNKWDSAAKLTLENREQLATTELWQVKVWFRRKEPAVVAMQSLVEELRNGSIRVPKLQKKKRPDRRRLALEICVMDPHLGMQAFRPGSQQAWDLDTCEQWYLWAVEHLLQAAKSYAPFEQIVWVFGNDFLHVDNVQHTTTAGTSQPEAISWHEAYVRGKKLAIAVADRLATEAALRIVQIPGNHDRQSSFTLGHVLDAYFHRNPNVTVDVSAQPYRFWNWGVNLVGWDHGHSVKADKLAALMAAETRLDHWQRARYCEWHLGDQHRTGGGRPVAMTEQGVGVEFLTGLTPSNEWHRIKGYLWQQRGAVAFVWDHEAGPVARLHANLDSYTGRPLGQ